MTTRRLDEIGSADAEEVGGKAAALGELVRLGVPVPRGFVVATSVYRDSAAAGGLVQALAPLLDAGDHAAVEETACAVLTATGLSATVRDAIVAAYHEMGSPPVAVRSSATAEDLVDASFAGQYDTLLDVRGDDAVTAAVTTVWASLWTRRAVDYRAGRAIDHFRSAMGVVVQEMVDADAAGVLFTVDPLTSGTGVMRGEIVAGAGERLVSGTAVGARFRIDRESLAVHLDDTARPLLDAGCAAQLGQTALQIERHFGRPQDIEFALTVDRLWILQARPMTGLPEVAPEPLPALGPPSLADRTMRPLAAERYVVAPRPLDNLTYRLMVGAAVHAVRRVGGLVSTADEAAFRARIWHQAYRLPPIRPTWRMLCADRTYLHLLETDWQAWWDGGPRQALVAVSAPVDLAGLSDQGTFERADRILAAWDEPLRRRFHAASAIQAGRWLGLLVGLAIGPRRRAAVVADLLSGIPTPTDEVNDALWDLSRLARGDAATRAAVDALDLGRVPETPAGDAFRDAFTGFIERHGHREGACFYLSTPTWRRDPTQVLRLLAAMATAVERPGGGPDARARFDAARALVLRRLRLLPWLPGAFGRLVDRLRALDAFRESSHYDLTRPLAALQDLAAEWGRRLVHKGVLDAADEIFDLTPDEVRSWLLYPSSCPADVRGLLTRRRATYRVVDARWQIERLGRPPRSTALRGTGAGAGVATGRVRIVGSEREFDRLRPGEVLVCPYSNPAWTPLFTVAAAVVSETGGLTSHAAIVAREVGIPAVMGVAGVTAALSDDDLVQVDGGAGVVTVVARAGTAAAAPADGG